MVDNPTPDDPTPDGAKPGDPGPGDASARPSHAPRPPAFPVSKLAVSAVGIAVGAWFWLGSGWRWDVTPRELAQGQPPLGLGSWAGRYVRPVGVEPPDGRTVEADDGRTELRRVVGEEGTTAVVRGDAGGGGRLSGRVVHARFGEGPPMLIIDATRGRWNARAGIAVVVVLWGIAHAGASIHMWRRRRRASDARGPG